MGKQIQGWVLAAALVCSVSAAGPAAPKAGRETALDRYVHRADPSYRWSVAKTLRGDGYTGYVLDLTSQTWRQPSEVDRTVWRHWLTVIVPEQVDSTTALLFITGGSMKDAAPARVDAGLLETARTARSVVAELRMVPNQPLVFAGDGKGLSEDALIVYTWQKFLNGGDDEWPARMPMTKAAVRAMDAVTAFCATPAGGRHQVEKFVVSGASKRGWTTWTTAAVDRRVVAIVPLVIDMLNLEPSFDHHWRAYGFWAPAVKNYDQGGILDRTGTRRYRELLQLVEPFSYRDRLTMPKYMIYAAGDQFFLPDSSQFYFGHLKGEKYLRYIPNTDHSLRNTDARQSLTAYYDALLHDRARPRFDWRFEKDGSIRVKTATKPTAARLWQAANAEARDFRLEKIGPAYRSTDLQEEGSGVWVARVHPPQKGWIAYFVELTFPSGGKYDFKFTTAVRVSPDRLPFPKYVPKRRP